MQCEGEEISPPSRTYTVLGGLSLPQGGRRGTETSPQHGYMGLCGAEGRAGKPRELNLASGLHAGCEAP